MNKLTQDFWKEFKNKDFVKAQQYFEQLNDAEKQAVFAQLFQQSGHQRTPTMVSVLRRKLYPQNNFNDFYQAWFPNPEMCQRVEQDGQVFQQHFPTQVRVINAINTNNPQDILSVGITWVSNQKEEQQLWQYINSAMDGNNEDNEIRHDKIQQVAEGELLGIYRVESDDNLGKPF